MPIRENKILMIGLPKTGLSSLCISMRVLGLKCIQLPRSVQEVESHDSAADLPIAANFELLDSHFPNSKFILSTRSKRQWLLSSRSHWSRYEPLISGDPLITRNVEKLYKTLSFNEIQFSLAYDEHEKRVKRYFQSRSQDLLIISVFETLNPWLPLCDFLSLSTPHVSFPHANRGKIIDELILNRLSSEEPEKIATDLNLSPQYIHYLFQESKRYS